MFYQQCIILECLYARQEFLSITFSLFPHLGIITMKVCTKFFLFLFFITHFSDCTSKFNKLLSILYIYIFRNMNVCFVDQACQTIKVHLKNRVLTSQEKNKDCINYLVQSMGNRVGSQYFRSSFRNYLEVPASWEYPRCDNSYNYLRPILLQS